MGKSTLTFEHIPKLDPELNLEALPQRTKKFAENGGVSEGKRHDASMAEAVRVRKRGGDFQAVRDAVRALNQQHNPPLAESEVAQIEDWVMLNVEPKRKSSLASPRAGENTRPNLISLEDVKPEAIEWLWPGYIPKGKITDVIGDGDLGKSLVLTDIVARMSRGNPMPDKPNSPKCKPINIIMLIGEDDVADTVVPRLIAARADLSRIKVLAGPNAGTDDSIIFPRDMDTLDAVTCELNAELVTIDPVMAFLGNVKTGIDSDVRTGLMGPLKGIASRNGCAILSLRHTNKSEGASASMRGGGSVAFRNAARAGLAFGPDHDDEDGERRIMVQSKKNLGRQHPALAYRIESTFRRVETEGREGTPVVVWDGVVEGATAASVLGPPPKESGPREGTKAEAATDWLRNRFIGVRAVAATVIQREMKVAGFSEKVIESAKKYANVESKRVSNGATGEGAWFWLLK
jgi:putative DNA primase/helicase